jgi:hypothetical protein
LRSCHKVQRRTGQRDTGQHAVAGLLAVLVTSPEGRPRLQIDVISAPLRWRA